MGADSFIAFYGIKIAIDPADEQMLDAVGSRSDPRCKAAQRAGLQSHWGRLTDGKTTFFLLATALAGWGSRTMVTCRSRPTSSSK
jgi:hypothetical protein